MNKADSQHLATHLEGLGYRWASAPQDADLVVLNSCVVRQSAEDRVLSRLDSLKALKASRPGLSVALTGCLVGSRTRELRERFPQVDAFFEPQAFDGFDGWLGRGVPDPDPEIGSPRAPASAPSTFVPIVSGCNNFCSYCIVPYRRGREKSRPAEEIVGEVQGLAARGVKEVVLLGQNVNAYGRDIPGGDLADLLGELDRTPGLARIRFLTSHPRDIDGRLMEALAWLPRVCEWISLPVQAGDDGVLEAMGRGYTIREYRNMVAELRRVVPGIGISTDVIVGFPGETGEQFLRTLEVIDELEFESVHVAPYSPRPGTRAASTMRDDVPWPEKKRRQKEIEVLQGSIASRANDRLSGRTLEILVEGRNRDRWQGHSRTGKLVFFDDGGDCLGRLMPVKVNKSGPWWLEGDTVPGG